MQIIVPHQNADFDALGAAVAAHVLYPAASIVLPGMVTTVVQDFLALHRYHLPIRTVKDIDLRAVEQVIVVDTTEPGRLGAVAEILHRAEVHLYDHHPREGTGLQGAVDVWAPVGACCTLFAELLAEANVRLTPFQATAILLGLYSDTGSLTLDGTTERDARAAAYLLAEGASLRALNRFLSAGLSPAQQALLMQLATSATRLEIRGARIALVAAETPEFVNGLSLIVHRLLELQPSPALFAVVRMGDRVHIVGRSEVPWVDAARTLGRFDGGGHRAAASAVVRGETLNWVLARLEPVLEETVQRPLLAREVMTAPVKSVDPSVTVHEAGKLMLRYGHSGLPVTDGTGQLVGVISRRDTEKAIRHGLGHAPVAGVMSRRLVTAAPDTPADEVQELLISRSVGRVPIIEDGVLVGIITRSNLLTLLYGGAPAGHHRTLYTVPQEGVLANVASQIPSVALQAMPPQVQHLLRVAGQVGAELSLPVYAVGGFVRDLLLGRPNLDIDLVVEGEGLQYAAHLAAVVGATVESVPRFKMAHLFVPGGPVRRLDVATARREYYEHAAALPVVEHADLREDLYRRDFSINALAVRLTPRGPSGLVDFFGGWEDLQAGQVRILHTLSFVEDPTRILRAARFACRYGFTLEQQTESCARQAVQDGYLERLSTERLRNDLTAVLEEPAAHTACALLHRLGALERILPGVRWDHELAALMAGARSLPSDLAGAGRAWLVRLLLLLHRLDLAAALELVARLKLRREETAAASHLLSTWREVRARLVAPGIRPAGVVELLRGQPAEGVALLWLLSDRTGRRRLELFWRKWRLIRLSITGDDLVAAGADPGPWIGTALARVLEARLDGAVSGREEELALALSVLKKEAAR